MTNERIVKEIALSAGIALVAILLLSVAAQMCHAVLWGKAGGWPYLFLPPIWVLAGCWLLCRLARSVKPEGLALIRVLSVTVFVLPAIGSVAFGAISPPAVGIAIGVAPWWIMGGGYLGVRFLFSRRLSAREFSTGERRLP